jgi:hypothetical protein
MAKNVGARRPGFTRKVLWIAAAAIFFLGGVALAAECYQCPWFQLGPTTMGMMPPGGYYGGGDAGGTGGGGPLMVQGPALGLLASPDMTLVQQQTKGGKRFTYVSTNKSGVYLIKRDGTPWLTVTYNKSTHLYEITDPNGTGSPVLKVGADPPRVIPKSLKR